MGPNNYIIVVVLTILTKFSLYFQVRGMGTALKILFSGDDLGPQSIVNKNSDGSNFQLNRVEIVSLFNAFGR